MLTPRKQVGFSWVDVLVSVAIIAILVWFLLPTGYVIDPSPTAATQSNMRQVWLAMLLYHEDTGEFLDGGPQSGELESLVAPLTADYLVIPDLLQDGWQRPILYERGTEKGVEFIRLRSLGRDGKPDAPGDDSGDDIVMDVGLVGDVITSRSPKQSLSWDAP